MRSNNNSSMELQQVELKYNVGTISWVSHVRGTNYTACSSFLPEMHAKIHYSWKILFTVVFWKLNLTSNKKLKAS